MKKYAIIALAMCLSLYAVSAMAGTGGTEFTEIYTTIQGWAQGYLGKTIALAAFVVGMALGITQQSIMAIALGIGGGIAVYYTPNIIDSLVVAVL